MKGFRDRLRTAISNSEDYQGKIQRLAGDAGLGEKTLYNMLNDERLDRSNTGPGLFAMSRVANLLGTSLDHLAGSAPPSITPPQRPDLKGHVAAAIDAQATTRDALSVDALLKTHVRSGGHLEAFLPWIETCDQYAPCSPTDSGIRVLRVGKSSLAALTMQTSEVDALQTALSSVQDDELKAKWITDYSLATDRGSLVSSETLDVQMPNKPVRVRMDFLRTLLRVSDSEGATSILNFSILVI